MRTNAKKKLNRVGLTFHCWAPMMKERKEASNQNVWGSKGVKVKELSLSTVAYDTKYQVILIYCSNLLYKHKHGSWQCRFRYKHR